MTEAGMLSAVTAATNAFGHAHFILSADGPLPTAQTTSQKLDFPFPAGAQHAYTPLQFNEAGFANVVFWSSGESAYDDLNANGRFDTGIDTVTLSPAEPFIDEDSNGMHDAAEPYWDTNVNDQWDSAPATYQRPAVVWDSVELVYTGSPAIQLVPKQFVDMNADGQFDPATDLVAVGGPVPEPFPFAAPATLHTFDASSYVTGATTVWVSFMDGNRNALPAGSTLNVAADSPAAMIAQPPLAMRTSPLAALNGSIVQFSVTGADLTTPAAESFQICATVHVADTDGDYGACFAAVAF